MRITIDTKADSLEDIRKVISLLQAVAGASNALPSYTNYPSLDNATNASPPSSYSPMSIFADDTSPSPPASTASSPAPSSPAPSMFTIFSNNTPAAPSGNGSMGASAAPVYTNADDFLRDVSKEENRQLGITPLEEEEDADFGDVDLIPYD